MTSGTSHQRPVMPWNHEHMSESIHCLVRALPLPRPVLMISTGCGASLQPRSLQGSLLNHNKILLACCVYPVLKTLHGLRCWIATHLQVHAFKTREVKQHVGVTQVLGVSSKVQPSRLDLVCVLTGYLRPSLASPQHKALRHFCLAFQNAPMSPSQVRNHWAQHGVAVSIPALRRRGRRSSVL